MVTEDVERRLFVDEDEVAGRLSELIDRTERGQTIAIMREGRVVSELIPGPEPASDLSLDDAMAEAHAFLDRVQQLRGGRPTGMTREEILAWRHEGHRL